MTDACTMQTSRLPVANISQAQYDTSELPTATIMSDSQDHGEQIKVLQQAMAVVAQQLETLQNKLENVASTAEHNADTMQQQIEDVHNLLLNTSRITLATARNIENVHNPGQRQFVTTSVVPLAVPGAQDETALPGADDESQSVDDTADGADTFHDANQALRLRMWCKPRANYGLTTGWRLL